MMRTLLSLALRAADGPSGLAALRAHVLSLGDDAALPVLERAAVAAARAAPPAAGGAPRWLN